MYSIASKTSSWNKASTKSTQGLLPLPRSSYDRNIRFQYHTQTRELRTSGGKKYVRRLDADAYVGLSKSESGSLVRSHTSKTNTEYLASSCQPRLHIPSLTSNRTNVLEEILFASMVHNLSNLRPGSPSPAASAPPPEAVAKGLNARS